MSVRTHLLGMEYYNQNLNLNKQVKYLFILFLDSSAYKCSSLIQHQLQFSEKNKQVIEIKILSSHKLQNMKDKETKATIKSSISPKIGEHIQNL